MKRAKCVMPWQAPGKRHSAEAAPASAAHAAAIMALLWLLRGSADASAGDANAGKATFLSICSSCHGLNGIATLDYAPSFAKCERLDQDDAKLLVSVRDGIGGRMPPWGTMLSEKQILDAIAYARTFCKAGQLPTQPPTVQTH
jgi:mono/diheme cytochrome c family protein